MHISNIIVSNGITKRESFPYVFIIQTRTRDNSGKGLALPTKGAKNSRKVWSAWRDSAIFPPKQWPNLNLRMTGRRRRISPCERASVHARSWTDKSAAVCDLPCALLPSPVFAAARFQYQIQFHGRRLLLPLQRPEVCRARASARERKQTAGMERMLIYARPSLCVWFYVCKCMQTPCKGHERALKAICCARACVCEIAETSTLLFTIISARGAGHLKKVERENEICLNKSMNFNDSPIAFACAARAMGKVIMFHEWGWSGTC